MAGPESDASDEQVTDGQLLRELAHELRDALSPVASALDALRLEKFAPEAGKRATDQVHRALQRALATIDTFVLAEQCERGQVAVTREPCSLRDILVAVRAALPETLAARCAFAPCADVAVSADVARSIEAISALLQHAAAVAVNDSRLEIRGTEGPQPEIRIRLTLDPARDVGEGWFAGFRGSAAGRMAPRTARQLLAAQQGGLRVIPCGPGECELVASFQKAADLEVQTRASAAQTRAQPLRANGSGTGPAGMRIIIVDDSAEVRKAYREPLVTLGYTVTEAVDAEQALRTLDGDPPHVALIDIHLPRMNGYRLAEALKARVGGSMRLIMLSGMTLDATTRRLSREAGFDDCLDKMAGPLALHLLLQGAAAR